MVLAAGFPFVKHNFDAAFRFLENIDTPFITLVHSKGI
jgi:hypothetical protein